MQDLKPITPQKGYQIDSLSSAADIVIGGGAAGVGKTWSLLMESIRHIDNKDFGAVFFRRTTPMIRNQGGLWDASLNFYGAIQGATPKESSLDWKFPSGAKVSFRHLEYEKNIHDWMGSEIPLIVFDELTHFTKGMFFYMLSRNRSLCGVKPYVRATCNPDASSWVAEFIDWWIDSDGYPDPAKQGRIRYFMVDSDKYIWGDTKQEVIEKGWYVLEDMVKRSGVNPEEFIKSLEFVAGSIYDNKELLEKNPAYLGNLNAQSDEVKQQLLHGNWKVKPSDNDIYHHEKFTDIFTNTFVEEGEKYITCDVALKGSDKLVIFAWNGKRLIDAIIIGRSDGKEVIDAIQKLASIHQVPESNILYDGDGVGGFVDGYIVGAQEFHNGGTPIDGENYQNKKTQMYYKSGDAVQMAAYYVTPHVANMQYDKDNTIREVMLKERKAIKRDKSDHDGKLRIIGKDKMKVINGGKSPDLLDAFMMREYFDYFGGFYVG